MTIITPFEFIETFDESRRVAVIGNAPSTLEYRNGAFIDSFDYVVRFNECTTKGYEENIGSKTSILIANPYAETRTRRILDGGTADVVIAIFSLTRRGDEKVFEAWAENHKVLYTYSPDLMGVHASAHKVGLTTGTYGLQLISRLLRPAQMLVTGFTMFSEEDHSHYWKAGIPGGIRAHDFQAEASIFVNLLNSFKCQTLVTQDVGKLIEKSGIGVGKHVRPVE